MKEDIQEAIKEFTPLYDLVTTSDLQGITEARAMQILRKHHDGVFDATANVLDVLAVSDEILEGIYGNITD
jgi:hypothetical protein